MCPRSRPQKAAQDYPAPNPGGVRAASIPLDGYVVTVEPWTLVLLWGLELRIWSFVEAFHPPKTARTPPSIHNLLIPSALSLHNFFRISYPLRRRISDPLVTLKPINQKNAEKHEKQNLLNQNSVITVCSPIPARVRAWPFAIAHLPSWAQGASTFHVLVAPESDERRIAPRPSPLPGLTGSKRDFIF